jgi:hypothetical protein
LIANKLYLESWIDSSSGYDVFEPQKVLTEAFCNIRIILEWVKKSLKCAFWKFQSAFIFRLREEQAMKTKLQTKEITCVLVSRKILLSHCETSGKFIEEYLRNLLSWIKVTNRFGISDETDIRNTLSTSKNI